MSFGTLVSKLGCNSKKVDRSAKGMRGHKRKIHTEPLLSSRASRSMALFYFEKKHLSKGVEC